jgi:hypothetical protein
LYLPSVRRLGFFASSMFLGFLACSDDPPAGGPFDARSGQPDGTSSDVGVDDRDAGGGPDVDDAGEGPDLGDADAGATDGHQGDAGDGGGSADGGPGDAGPFSCPIVEPDPGVRRPTNALIELGDSASFAVNPCSGEIGYVWATRAGGARSEVFFRVLAKNGVDMSAPVRLTVAPGASYQPRVVFVRDRYVILWTDQRHDPFPDACGPCREELYFAAVDLGGAVLLPERRLTDKPNTILHLTARGHAQTDRVLATWVDRRNGTEIYAAFIGPDGTVDVERQVNEPNTGTEAYYPRPLWNGREWLIFYSDRPGSDHRYVRSIDPTGAMGSEVPVGWGYNQAADVHGGGYVTLASSTGAFGTSLLFLDTAFQPITELQATFANTHDGTWAIRSTGTSIWVTNGDGQGTGVNELNNLGVFLRSIDADPNDVGRPADVEMDLVGGRIVLEWHYTGFSLSVLQP